GSSYLVSRRRAAGGLTAAGARRGGARDDPVGGSAARGATGVRPARLRDRTGRHRRGASYPLDRRDHGARLRRLRARRPRHRRGPRPDVRDGQLGRAAAACRPRALLHGHRRPSGRPRGDRTGNRHVRLRFADAHRADRQRADVGGASEHAQRPLRPRHGAAAGRLRVRRLQRLLARLRAAPRQPAGAARPPAAQPPQSTIPPRFDGGRESGDRTGRVRRVQTGRARAPRGARGNGGRTSYLIVIVALFVLLYLLILRPQRRRTTDQLRMQDTLQVGDEVITAGGIRGEVRQLDEEVLKVEIAPDIVVRVDRRAIAAVVTEPEDDAGALEEAEPDES